MIEFHLINLGPFKIDETVFRVKDPIRVKRHPYSWSKVSSLLFVDSPVGAGYSYADNQQDYVSDDSITVADLYAFLNKVNFKFQLDHIIYLQYLKQK